MNAIKDILRSMEYGPAPEDAAAARAWLARRPDGFGHFIGGAFEAPGALFETRDPATGEILSRVTQGSAEDVARAVAAARKAQTGWAALSGHARARHLYALARHLQQHARLFAVLETLDNGKPIRESRDVDVPLAVRHFYHHAGWAELARTEFPGARPRGVCGQIIPWNFPLLMLAWKVAPALAAGNAAVLKPAEYTPLTALAFAEIAQEAGLPAGVLNIVTGDGETGAALVAAEGVDKIAFTGSTAVGREIRRATAGSGKALTLELGGKSPAIVFPDADLDAAVEGVVDGVWFNQGEVCCAGARILVAEAVAERFEALLRARMARLRVGDPLDKCVDVGAVVDPVQHARIEALLKQGAAEGATIHRIATPDAPREGCFCAPTLVTGADPASTLATEEIFGPVATLTTFRTPEDAVALANATRYGLAASVWSEGIGQALEVAARLKAGVVWVNGANMFDAAAPFGGWRESGFGREGGREGMEAYLAPPPLSGPGGEAAPEPAEPGPLGAPAADAVDRTAKFHIGGRQTRPDSGYSYPITGPGGRVGLAGLGSRKDVRDAVEAASKAAGWAAATGHARAQILYYVAENLAARRAEFAARLESFGAGAEAAAAEVETAVARCFRWAAQADKIDGAARPIGPKTVALAMREPLGVVGIACPTAHPLLGFVSTVLPAIAAGNAVVAIPSQPHPLAATDLYQVFDTSDLPAGVVNIVAGPRAELAETLARHDGVAALWWFGDAAGGAMVERESAGNLKQVWAEDGAARLWTGAEGADAVLLDRATQAKTVWIPYGA